MVTIEYVDIDAQRAAGHRAAADEAALRARYEQEKTRFVEPEQRLASHILIRVDEGRGRRGAEGGRSRRPRNSPRRPRQPGADFAALARANSDDAGSKANGGDLGWVQKGVMAAPFEQALFAHAGGRDQRPGQDRVRLARAAAARDQDRQAGPFEQVREELAREQADADRERAFNDLTGKLVDQVYKNPTLAGARGTRSRPAGAEARSVRARRRAPGIAANPAVQRAAFSETLIQDGTVSDPIEIAPEPQRADPRHRAHAGARAAAGAGRATA